METQSSRSRAKQWPYRRHRDYVKVLRNAAKNWFADNPQVQTHSKMPYCLNNISNWKYNMILPEVYDYIEKMRREKSKDDAFPLHKYIHHGLSSQAMVFNLIGSLIVKDDLNPLLDVLRRKGVALPDKDYSAEFEYEDRLIFNEDSGQPTSIDLVIKDKNGDPLVFIESKLTESEFGICSVFSNGDCNGKTPINDLNACYLHFICRQYWDKMNKHGILTKVRSESICVFALYYQFFREILFSMEQDGTFVLLHDSRSPVFRHEINGKEIGLLPFLANFIPDQKKPTIIDITIQEVALEIGKYRQHENWIKDFRRKYGLKIII